MKKFALIVAMVGAFLVLVSIALNSWLIQKDAKKSKEESSNKAHEGKALLKKLIPIADELGIDWEGMSARQLQAEIELAQREQAESEIKEILNDGKGEDSHGKD